MAGLRGNQGWFAAAKQTGRGTPATAPASKQPFHGGNIMPRRDTDRLVETDSSRDQGAAFTTQGGVEGSPELYVRDSSLAYYLGAAFGSLVTTGTTPNYTHVIKPGDSLAYYTFWRNIGNTLYEEFDDCFVSSINVKADTGQPLTATLGVQGLKPVRLAADPAAGVVIDKQQVYSMNDASGLLILGGASTRLISSFDFTLENNVAPQQTDDFIPYDLSTGLREISLGFDIIFENLDEYNKFHYGGAAGTQISRNIFTTSATFEFSLGANNDIKFVFPSIAYEEFPVEPNPGGDPITVSCRAVAQKATGITDLVTATIKNQTPSYATL